MTFLAPLGLLAAAMAVPIVLLHILIPRRERVEVSSLLLWRFRNNVPVKALAPWQRLRFSVPFLLQMLAVLLLALALAGLASVRQVALAGHTVFVVDGSGSMASIDGSPDRLAEAVDRVGTLLDELPEGGVASVVVAGPASEVLVAHADERDELDRALRSIRTTAGTADFSEAFLLADSLALDGRTNGVVLVTDGGVAETAQAQAPVGTVVELVGEVDTNRAVLGLAARRLDDALLVRTSIANTGGPAATQELRLVVDGETIERRRLELPAGEVVEREFELPEGDRVSVFLEGEDLLATDNQRYVVVPEIDELQVGVIGERNFFVDELLEAMNATLVGDPSGGVGSSGPVDTAEALLDPDLAEADVLILNQVDVPPGIDRPFVAIQPPNGAPGVEVVGTVEDPIPSFVRDEPLLESVDVTRLAIAEAQRLDVIDGEVLLGAAGAPLLVRGSTGGSVTDGVPGDPEADPNLDEAADDGAGADGGAGAGESADGAADQTVSVVPFFYFPFALERSNLPVEVAFPVLGSRMVSELLAIERLDTGFLVGERLPDTFTGTLVSPRSVEQTLAANFGSPAFDQAGFWTARADDGTETVIAVNADTIESILDVPDELAAIPVGVGEDEPEQLTAGTVANPLVVVLVAILLAVVVIEFLWWWRSVGWKGPGRQRLAVGLRLIVVLLLLAALIDPPIRRASDEMTTVFIVDTSASMTDGGIEGARAMVAEALDERDGRYAVVEVDQRARLTDPVGEGPYRPSSFEAGLESDIGRGLRLGQSTIGIEGRRRIVLISDGRSTSGDLIDEATRLERLGVPVDVIVPSIGELADAAVINVDAPSVAEPSTVVSVTAEIASNIAGPAEVSLIDAGETGRGDRVIDRRQVELEVGTNQVSFDVRADEPGIARYQVRVAAEGDQTARNDIAATAIEVAGAAEVLVVEGSEGDGSIVVEALEANGIGATVTDGIGSLDELRAYRSVVLVDMPAERIPPTEMAALSSYVRELGRGLVVIGGDNAYGLGGYGETELEDLLPVDSNVKDVQREASVAEVLLIDTSESMGACHCRPADGGGLGDGENLAGGEMEFIEGEGPNKTDISRAGAARAIRVLNENDEVGVLAFNASQDWIIPLQQLPSEEVVTEGLGQLRPIGETRIGPALDEAAASLRASNKELKHIILFTDGFTPELPSGLFMGSGMTEEQIEQEMEFMRQEMGIEDDVVEKAAELAAEGITISVVATGEGAIPDLAAIAEAGNGRFYPGRDLDEVPEIFVREARLASRSVINEGEFFPTVTGNSAVTAALDASPPLKGYVATSPKTRSRVQLTVSEFNDPLLASWRIGLGKVTAWTSDAGDRWGTEWAAWDGNPDFWANLVRDTFPLAGTSGVRVATRFDGSGLDLTLETADELPSGATVTAFVSGPDGEDLEVRLERQSDGTYGARVDAAEEGTYSVGVQVDTGGEVSATATALATRSYPTEFTPGSPDREVLQALSDATGGRGFITPDQAFDRDGLTAGGSERRFRWWYLLAALVLWPIDIAVRRLGGRLPGSTGLGRFGTGRFGTRLRGRASSRRPSLRPRRPTPTAPTA